MFPRYLLLIRHAESLGNKRMRQADQDPNNPELIALLKEMLDKDWPITPEGKRRAEWAGELYQTLFNFERGLPKLYSSSHLRAILTSSGISKKWERPSCLWQRSDEDLEWPTWIIDPDLCERSWGTKDNLSWKQFELWYPDQFREYMRDPLRFRPDFPGAESILDVRNLRAIRFLQRLERECSQDDLVIVVSHADWILACRSLLENLDPFQFKIMHDDPKQRIHNLDAVCYSCEQMPFKHGILSTYPTSVGLIHLPFEETSLDQVEPINWQKIESYSYNRDQLIELTSL